MTTTVQLRRGTNAANNAFTGAVGELTVDITNTGLRLHNGSTAGGNPVLMGSQLGVASGVASLDGTGKVPSAQVPTTFAAMTVLGLYNSSNTLSGSSPTAVDAISVSESITAGTGFQIAASIITTRTGGSGHREALHVEQLSSASSAGEFVVGITGIGHVTSGSGSIFGLNGVGWVDSGAASTAEVSGGEFNTDVRRSVNRKTGVQIIDVSTSTGSGTVIDAGLFLSKQAGAVGFSCGIQFGDSSQFPVIAGGKIMAAVGSSIPTLASGIDFSGLSTTVASFVAKAGGNGFAFGVDFGGGLIRSAASSGAGILTFNSGNIEVSQGLSSPGYRSRSGLGGSYGTNYLNFFWNTSTNKVDLYVDNTRIGAITTT